MFSDKIFKSSKETSLLESQPFYHFSAGDFADKPMILEVSLNEGFSFIPLIFQNLQGKYSRPRLQILRLVEAF